MWISFTFFVCVFFNFCSSVTTKIMRHIVENWRVSDTTKFASFFYLSSHFYQYENKTEDWTKIVFFFPFKLNQINSCLANICTNKTYFGLFLKSFRELFLSLCDELLFHLKPSVFSLRHVSELCNSGHHRLFSNHFLLCEIVMFVHLFRFLTIGKSQKDLKCKRL